jgi:hypothetical protein
MGNDLEFRGKLRDRGAYVVMAAAAVAVLAVVGLGMLPDDSGVPDIEVAGQPSPSLVIAHARPAAPSPTPEPRAWTDPTIDEYVARVRAICLAADGRVPSGGSFDDPVSRAEAAVRNADAALAELRRLTPPDVIRPDLTEVFVYLEAPIDVLRFVVWAESNAAPGVAAMALEERVAVTHWRDGRLQDLGDTWVARSGPWAGVLSPTFQNCPLRMGA